MQMPFLRSSDIACGFALMFLFGTFAAAYGWNIGACFFFVVVLGLAAIAYLWKANIFLCSFCTLIIAVIIGFPLSAFYYHMRIATDVSTVARVTATVNPFFVHIAAIFQSALPYRQASLLTGIVSGSTAGLAPDVKLAMTQSGTSYIVGMYGYKIHLLMEAAFGICKKICPRRIASLIALAVIAVFIALANAPISALRAGILAGLALLAESSGRKFNARIALIFTASGMILIDPSLWKSGGFLLSYMSLVGIYAIAPSFNALLEKIIRDKNSKNNETDRANSRGFLSWRFHLVTTAAVNLAIVPIAMALYGDFPAISFVSNFFIALPFGIVIALGIALAIVGNFFSVATFIFAPALNLLLSYQLLVIRIFAPAAWPFPVSFSSSFAIIIYYSALALFVFRYTPRDTRAVSLI